MKLSWKFNASDIHRWKKFISDNKIDFINQLFVKVQTNNLRRKILYVEKTPENFVLFTPPSLLPLSKKELFFIQEAVETGNVFEKNGDEYLKISGSYL